MTVPFWCLLIACIIPVVLAGVSGYYRYQQFGDVDNKHPRAQAAKLEGAGARAVAAQQNAWEALIVFTAATMVAHLTDPGTGATAAVIFILARIAHAVTYILDIDALRSLSFLLGYGCCIAMFM